MSGFSSRVALALGLMVLAFAPRAGADEPLAAALPCPEEGDVVTVIAQKHELWLCQQGLPVGRFRVALGRGGVDKRREGDLRTPVGTYALGIPRPSVRFGVFIPIDYPTVEQVSQGFTGSEIGIHGPPRGVAEPDYPITYVDWTRGCIATARDAEIEFIADFVRTYEPMLVVR